MGLGDSFSENERRQTFQRQFHAGRVCRLFCHFTKPPKDKLLLVACINPKPLFLVINSEINDFIQIRQHLLERQVRITESEHNFLTHDSYINCTEAIDCFSLEFIEQEIVADLSARLLGTISKTVSAEVIKAVQAARTLELRHKQWILAELAS